MDLDVFQKWEEIKSKSEASLAQVYILSTFTANPVEPYLGIELFQRGLTRGISFGPYNRVVQQMTDTGSPVYGDGIEDIVLWIRMEDMVESLMTGGPGGFGQCLDDADAVAEAVAAVSEKTGKHIIFVLPAMYDLKPAGTGDLQIPNGMTALSAAFRNRFITALSGRRGILLCDAEEAVRKVSAGDAFDPAMYALAKVPYTGRMFEAAARLIAECIRLFADPDPDVLVFDSAMLISEDYDVSRPADRVDHLTGHVIARDDSAHMFQQYLRMLSGWGCRLMFCTASDEKSARDVFSDPDIMLPYETAEYVYYGCDSVKKAVGNIAAASGKSPGRFILITRRAPETDGPDEIRTLRLPEDRSLWAKAINDSDCTTHIPGSIPWKGDRSGNGGNNFFSGLQLSVTLKEAVGQQLAQVEHLLRDVHDFRFTNTIWKMEELSAMIGRPDYRLTGVYVSDRFGDYGMAGLIAGHAEGRRFHIDDMMLNCRILGKRVEYHVMDQLAESAWDRGYTEIGMRYAESGRNKEAAEFIAEMAGIGAGAVSKGEEIVVSCGEVAARALEHINKGLNKERDGEFNRKISGEERLKSEGAAELLRKAWNRKTKEMQNRIVNSAVHLATAEDIMNEINAACRRPQMCGCEYAPPVTGTEKELARLWAEILHLEKVGIKDNFFAIGGTSVLATQLIVRFKETFGIQLPVRIFFDKSNIEQMALYIDAVKSEQDQEKLNKDAIQDYRANLREFLRGEVRLDESIKAEGKPGFKSAAESSDVFLTGATGFLGAFLLYEILNRTGCTVHCLVRASGEQEGMKRIADNLSSYGIWDESYSGRIRAVCGDMSKPLLGLSTDVFEDLSGRIDMIYHCGANTNFLEPYPMLKAANVGGTQEILRLASAKRLKIVHFVSTHYVFSTISNPADHAVHEDEIPSCNEVLIMGYQQTKLISEQMIVLARKRGIPVNIYRPGRISGSSVTGACQNRDFVWLMTKCCVESGMVFAENSKIELIPVDYVSEAIVAISLNAAALNRNFHIVNLTRTPMGYISKWMEERGFRVEKYPYMEWKEKLTERISTGNGPDSVRAMLPFLNDEAEMEKSLRLGTENADEILKNSGVVRKEVDRELFNKYLDYFIRTGFFTVPDDKNQI